MRKRSYRYKSSELEELDTILPFLKKLRGLVRGGFFSTFFILLLLAIVILFSKKQKIVSIIASVLLIFVFIVFGFINNRKNQKAIIAFLEFKPIAREKYFKNIYSIIFRLHQFIRTIDGFFIYPVTFPFKIIGGFFYRIFRFKFKRIRKLILKNKKNIFVYKDIIENDPFYTFLKREGLYDPNNNTKDPDIQIDDSKLEQ